VQVRLVPSHWQVVSAEQFVFEEYLKAHWRSHFVPPVDHEHMGFCAQVVKPADRWHSSRQTPLVASHWQAASFTQDPSLL
jgi:hypothetical protein